MKLQTPPEKKGILPASMDFRLGKGPRDHPLELLQVTKATHAKKHSDVLGRRGRLSLLRDKPHFLTVRKTGQKPRLSPICIYVKVKAPKSSLRPGPYIIVQVSGPVAPASWAPQSGPGLQGQPEGQLCQVAHVRLFASPLDVVQGFHHGPGVCTAVPLRQVPQVD